MTGKKKVIWGLGICLGVVAVLAAAGIFFWKWKGDPGSVRNPPSISGQVVFPVPGTRDLRFDHFLIPLPADAAHTGISFSVVIRYRDSAWSNMSDQEKTWLRARIYDTLVSRMRELESLPEAAMVALWAERAVKQALSNRPFEAVVIDNVFIL
jgi:hypothetical protein